MSERKKPKPNRIHRLIYSNWSFCYYERMLNEFDEMHDDIELVWEDEYGWDATLYNNLQEAIEDGNAPDITIGESFLPTMVADDQLLPLNFTEDEIAEFVPATMGYALDDNGTAYAVPAYTSVFTLEINADLFYTAGLIPETQDLRTWDGVLNTAQEIHDNGLTGFNILGQTGNPSAALFRIAPYVYQAGGSFCNADCSEITFNDPANVDVYQWIRDLYDTNDTELIFEDDESVVFSTLFSGGAAMQTAGAWHVGWGRGSGCNGCQYYPLPVPEDGTQANVVVGNAMFAVLADTEHPEEAMEFIRWVASDDVQNAVFYPEVGGRFPAKISALNNIIDVAAGDEEAFETIPDFFTDELGNELEDAPAIAQDYLIFIDQLLNSDVRTLPFLSVAEAELWNEMFMEILTSDEPVADILDTYQMRAEEIE